MTPVIAHIRSLGIRIVIYLDDILILHQDPSVLQSIFRKVVSLLEGLGFLINLNKCSQFPSQQLIFLGTMLNTVTMSLSLRTEKLDLIQQGELQPRTKGKTSLQELAALLGHMRHAAQKSEWHLAGSSALLLRVHSAGTLRYRGKGSKQSLELSREAMKDVEEPQSTNTQHLRCPPVDLVIHTDASLLGWGGGNSRQHLHQGRGVTVTYQCTGAQSSISSNPSFHEESEITTGSYPPAHRQHHSGGTYQQEGGTLTVSVSNSTGTLVSCPQDQILGDSNTYSRNTQCRCRHGISSIQPQSGMDIGPQIFRKKPFSSPGGRSVCIKANPPGEELCLQISRSGSNSSRRFSPRLEQVEEFHTLSCEHSSSGSEEDPGRGSIRPGNNTELA